MVYCRQMKDVMLSTRRGKERDEMNTLPTFRDRGKTGDLARAAHIQSQS